MYVYVWYESTIFIFFHLDNQLSLGQCVDTVYHSQDMEAT